ncbi:hypothetical protein NEOLEDRAFT_1148798 [Neolentinus lepideus HHB14362 ss-1]|uniref:Uncharacterized protein n=1 Tax=Neolentinus lepideus HHB14362 ss-1 TaxID=1314782 RepID=A0A165RRD0_9AGAM|nr:hypothetical protein NEOLEDRAFT_1148798 [Neolentinus lepideus HHB14362 ss-1]
MVFPRILAIVLCFLGSVVAIPVMPSVAGCDSLGTNASDTAARPFTLAALNTTLPNANSTGAPLVLGQNGEIEGAEFEVLSTWASFPDNDWPTLSLDTGGLYGNSQTQYQAVSSGATNGTTVNFMTTSRTSYANQVFCIVPSPLGLPLLALDGHVDEFSLCSNGKESQNNVIYNATHKSYEYNYSTCYPVVLQVVEGL